MYVVYCRIGLLTLPLNCWQAYYDAHREAESLNKVDFKAYYYVRYKENIDGKNIDLRPHADSQVQN